MATSLQQKNQHLLWRAGFGIDISSINSLATLSTKELTKALFSNTTETPVFLETADESLKKLYTEVTDSNQMMTLDKVMDKFSKEQRQQIQKQSRDDIRKLNLKWLDEMTTSSNPLREKMSLFWHGHFACREQNIFHQQNLLHTIRANALGSFKDLLVGVSKSASMISFLNNQQNKKQHPNENFAREVMELFTLGRGNYTENDIKEAARAFTGWSFKINGEFVFRRMVHDDGSKTVLGKTGFFDGDDVLNILLEQKQTAKYITQKIYKYFVNDVVDKDKVDWLSNRFYKNNYNIAELMKDIFNSDWFYDEKNIGSKIKSPVELLVGIRKQLNIQLNKPEVQLVLENALGQVLFNPPNVAGWPGGKNWIDSSSLMLRLQIPRLIKDDEELNITTKTDDDVQMGMMREMFVNKMQMALAKKYRIEAKINWADYVKSFEKTERNKLLDSLKLLLLQTNNSSINNSTVENNINQSSREEFIKTATVALMSSPEYQLM